MTVDPTTSRHGCQDHRLQRCRRPRGRALWVSVVVSFTLLPCFGQEVIPQAPSAQQSVNVKKEYNVKGVYLFNFARYVTWPQSQKLPRGEFRIGVLGDSPIMRPLNALAQKKQIRDRHTKRKVPLRIRQFKTLDDYQPCHILVIPRAVSIEQRREIAMRFANQPVLVIGESPNFARSDGTAGFVMMNGGIGFDLNLADAKRKGLKLDAKLLKAAKGILKKIEPVTLSKK